MSIGWFKLHRKLIDSRVFANEGLLRLWIYCLCRANHEKNYVDIYTGKGKTEVEINAGEFIFGRNVVAKELKMNPSTLYKRMQKLETIGNINIKSNTHYSIVSICNWKVYQRKKSKKEQPKEQPSNNQVTGKEQPSNTDKNEKNVRMKETKYAFDFFWELYDKKRDRKKCESKWNNISEKDKEEIIKFIPIYKDSEPNEQYRKYPYTFLNSEIWKDDWSDYKNENKLKTEYYI